MAFKKKAVVNARLDQMSKAELIKTVKTLRTREKALLNQVTKLEGGQADRLLNNLAPAVEFGYRAGEKGVDNLEMTLRKWSVPQTVVVDIESRSPSGTELDDMFERHTTPEFDDMFACRIEASKFPWETE